MLNGMDQMYIISLKARMNLTQYVSGFSEILHVSSSYYSYLKPRDGALQLKTIVNPTFLNLE